MRSLIIFDLDDTLIDTSDLYWRVRSEYIKYISQFYFKDLDLIDLFEFFDTINSEKIGHDPNRYYSTMLDVVSYLGLTDYVDLEYIHSISNDIKSMIPKLLPHALDLLKWVHGNYDLALITRGDSELQMKKIQHYELSMFFPVIEIVPIKNSALFSKVITNTGHTPSNTVILGDSIKSDINPALEIGATAIHYMYSHHAYYWLQEHTDKPINDNYFKVSDLSQVRKYLKP